MSEPRAGPHRAECTRVIAAPKDLVYEAWSDPLQLEAWMTFRESGGGDKPRLIAVRNVAIAPEPGAPFRIDMVTREPDGSERVWPHSGQVLEATSSTLSFSWTSEGTGHRETRVRLRFVEAEGGTELRLVHDGFAEATMAREHAEGWDILLELLSEAMLSAMAAGVKLGVSKIRSRFASARRKTGQAPAGKPTDGAGDG